MQIPNCHQPVFITSNIFFLQLKVNYKIKRGTSHFSLSLRWFSCGSFILVELEFGDVGICEGREKPQNAGKNPDEGQQQTQPTYSTR